MKIKASYANQASFRPISARSNIPTELKKLEELAHNMWWAWNHDARSLFRNIDEKLFDECGGNPVMLRTAGVVSIHRTDDTRVSAELRDGVVCFATEPGARYIIET